MVVKTPISDGERRLSDSKVDWQKIHDAISDEEQKILWQKYDDQKKDRAMLSKIKFMITDEFGLTIVATG